MQRCTECLFLQIHFTLYFCALGSMLVTTETKIFKEFNFIYLICIFDRETWKKVGKNRKKQYRIKSIIWPLKVKETNSHSPIFSIFFKKCPKPEMTDFSISAWCYTEQCTGGVFFVSKGTVKSRKIFRMSTLWHHEGKSIPYLPLGSVWY